MKFWGKYYSMFAFVFNYFLTVTNNIITPFRKDKEFIYNIQCWVSVEFGQKSV